MELISNAKEIATKAWSVRLNSMAAVFAALEIAQPLLQLAVPDKTFSVISGLMVLGGLFARFVKQENIAAALATVQVALDGE